jgi:hypothetical protein
MEQVEPPDLELESFLASPPTLGEVLKDPLLYQVFHWHLVSRLLIFGRFLFFFFFVFFGFFFFFFSSFFQTCSRFAPENLMFRTAVQEYQASIKKGDLKEARDRLKGWSCSVPHQ